MNTEQIAALIANGMPNADIDVRSDDNTHFEARIVSSEFAGKRSLQRHQMVYATLGELVGREIHALALQTLTPEEARNAS